MFVADQPAVIAPGKAVDQSDVIEVIGRRADQALKIDRRTYQVQQTPHSQQKDAIQLLRGLPAVTVAPDDSITLLGSTGVRIFVDGRPYQGDATQYLRTLHGSDVERIEVITNPSAQYSSEGTGGIINFVLRKKSGDGVSGNVSGEVSTFRGGYVDAALKVKHGKWTYEFHGGGRAGATARSTYRKRRSVEDVPVGVPTINTENGGGPTVGAEGEGSAKISYEVDPRTTVSARIMGAGWRNASRNRAEFIGVTPDFRSFDERQHLGTAASFVATELNFDHKGKKDGETLTASLRLYGEPIQHERNSAHFSNGASLFTDKRKHFANADGQIDWQHPMGKGEILSLGGTWDRSTMRERYHFESSGTGLLGFTAADEFEGRDDKLAAYVTFQQPIADWTVMPGLRVESDSRQISSRGHPDVRISRTDLFPTLHADHQLSPNLDLTLSYSKRIARPPINELRPYEIVQDVLTVKRGNPNLRNESTDAYEINLHYHRKSMDAGMIIYDRETSDLFSSDYSVINGINVSMLVNAGHSRDRGAEFDVSTPIVKHVKLNASVNLFDQRMPVLELNGRQSDERFRYTANTTIQWTGPDRGKRPGDVAQLQWIYSSPEQSFEIHNFAWNLLSLSYTHSFTKTVSITGTVNYTTGNGHRLDAPLVQEYFAETRPPEFKLKLLKTFGAP